MAVYSNNMGPGALIIICSDDNILQLAKQYDYQIYAMGKYGQVWVSVGKCW